MFLITLLGLFNQAIAVNYKDKIFKTDSVITVIRETQIGRNFFNAGSNNVYAYTTKLGMQIYCFQLGINAEREFINTTAYNQNYLQRTKSLGLFFGIELPVTKKLDVGLIGIYSAYKPNLEQPVYISNSSNIKLFDLGNDNIFQTQLRFNYKLNKSFSVIGTANFNTSSYVYNEGQLDHDNFFRVNLGLRYSLYPLNNNLPSSNAENSKRIRIFAGSNLEWKNANIPEFIGKEITVSGNELLKLSRAGSENVNSHVYALLGIADKRNNMVLFGINQRDFIQYSPNFQLVNSNSNWKLDMKDLSTRVALEFNLFTLANERTVNNFKPVYPFIRVSATYSNKNFTMLEGWDNSSFATDSTFYIPRVDNKAQTKSLEINNSLGIAMKLNRFYVSAGFNLFNRTYGEVKYERKVTRDYFENISPQNYIESKTEVLPVLESKGWLDKPIDPVNVFFTIGLVL